MEMASSMTRAEKGRMTTADLLIGMTAWRSMLSNPPADEARLDVEWTYRELPTLGIDPVVG